MAHHFDEEEFVAVAKVVARHNKYFLNADEEILNKMHAIAFGMSEPGYCATAGFMLTAFVRYDGVLAIKPSVSHTIL